MSVQDSGEVSVQDCGEELSLHLEDGEFMEECQAVGNNSVKVSPMSTQKRLREPDEDPKGEYKKIKVLLFFDMLLHQHVFQQPAILIT